MLKDKHSPYKAGREKGLWYKWKRDPLYADLVIMYAQRGHGKRSSYYSDFTLGAWQGSAANSVLVPVCKAYSGFTDSELAKLDKFVRENTINRYGPVREVDHALVVEVAFDSCICPVAINQVSQPVFLVFMQFGGIRLQMMQTMLIS